MSMRSTLRTHASYFGVSQVAILEDKARTSGRLARLDGTVMADDL